MENREYKDSLFKNLFSIPEYSVELINALLDTNYTIRDIKNVTLTNVLKKDIYNDLAFLTSGNELIVLIEHQSTLNCNMPLRMLLYLVDEYKRIIDSNNFNLYRNKLIKLPTPKFFVIYTNEEAEEKSILRLSDSFDGETTLNLDVICYNILKPNTINEKSKTLHDYASFLQFVLSSLKQGKTLKEAIELAVIECQKSETLNQYLNDRKSEVFDMLALEFDIDKLKAASYEDGMEDGIQWGMKKGREEGREENRKEMIIAFFQSGISVEQIAKAVKLPEETILQILEDKKH